MEDLPKIFLVKEFGGRLNVGAIIPLVKNQVAPFIKQFSVGGPNSLEPGHPGFGSREPFNPTNGNVLPLFSGRYQDRSQPRI